MTTVAEAAAKACTKCRITKPIDEYYRAKNSSDDRKSWCKTCCNEHSEKVRATNRDKALAAAAEQAEADARAAVMQLVRDYETAVDAYYAEPEPYTYVPVYQVRRHEPDRGPDADWRHRAACVDKDPELFFPVGNTGPALLQIEEAKAVCRRCPEMEACLQWALETGQDSGVWGGMSEDERRALKRRAARLRANASA